VQRKLKPIKLNVILSQLWLSRFPSSGAWRRAVLQINTNVLQQSRKVSVRTFKFPGKWNSLSPVYM